MKLFEISRTREQRELLQRQEPIAKRHVLGNNVRFTREGLVTADYFSGVLGFNGPVFPLSFAPISGTFYVSNCPNLIKIARLPPRIGGNFIIEHSPKFPVLSLIKVKDIAALFIVSEDNEVENSNMIESIWHKHYKPSGDGDILACQDELIDAGFASIAKM